MAAKKKTSRKKPKKPEGGVKAPRSLWAVIDNLAPPYHAYTSKKEAEEGNIGGEVAGPYVLAERRRNR